MILWVRNIINFFMLPEVYVVLKARASFAIREGRSCFGRRRALGACRIEDWLESKETIHNLDVLASILSSLNRRRDASPWSSLRLADDAQNELAEEGRRGLDGATFTLHLHIAEEDHNQAIRIPRLGSQLNCTQLPLSTS